MNACNNASNPDINQQVDQLAATIAQIATVITQANGVPIAAEILQLGLQIPQVVIPLRNE